MHSCCQPLKYHFTSGTQDSLMGTSLAAANAVSLQCAWRWASASASASAQALLSSKGRWEDSELLAVLQ